MDPFMPPRLDPLPPEPSFEKLAFAHWQLLFEITRILDEPWGPGMTRQSMREEKRDLIARIRRIGDLLPHYSPEQIEAEVQVDEWLFEKMCREGAEVYEGLRSLYLRSHGRDPSG